MAYHRSQSHADAAGLVTGAQFANEPLGLLFTDIPGDDHEFIAAHAEHGDIAVQGLHGLDRLLDEMVSGFMALGIIDPLETVEIAKNKGQGNPIGHRPDIFRKAPAVAGTGQLVCRAEAFQRTEGIAVAQHTGQEQGQRRQQEAGRFKGQCRRVDDLRKAQGLARLGQMARYKAA